MVKFQYGISETMHFGIRYTPWAHESTHLGDEYTIFAVNNIPGFERINVSYEYQEYGSRSRGAISSRKVTTGNCGTAASFHGARTATTRIICSRATSRR